MSAHLEILTRIQDVLVGTFGLSRHEITMDAQIYSDLDLDSFDAIDLAVTLEVETGVKLEGDDLRSIRRISDIVAIVAKRSTP